MIAGIGVDIIHIERVMKSIHQRGDRLGKRILHPDEWQVYQQKTEKIDDPAIKIRKKALFISKHFAAKEALVKALGTGMRYGLSFQAIQIKHDKLGKPFFIFHEKTAQAINARGINHSHLSLSDEQQSVVAFVVLER